MNIQKKINEVNFSKYKAVIFDVDGTLYDLNKMHRYMMFAFLKYYFLHFWQCADLLIIYYFRKNRELLSRSGASNINEKQYLDVANKFFINKDRVKKIIEYWMQIRPLEYINKCAFLEIKTLIEKLYVRGMVVIYYSDYHPLEKIIKLGLPYSHWFDGSEKEIDSLKPSDDGLKFILNYLGLKPDDCVLVGDRYDKDGMAAKKINMDYIILN